MNNPRATAVGISLVVAVSLAVAVGCGLALWLLGTESRWWHHALGGAIIGAPVGVAIFGVLDAPAGERLRWLFWPQLGLVALLTHLAYVGAVPVTRILGWPGADKVGHLLLFGLLGLSLDRWLRWRDLKLGRLRLPWALLLVSGCAAIDEALQSLSAARSADLLDLACDLTGMVLLIALGRCLSRRMQRWSEAAGHLSERSHCGWSSSASLPSAVDRQP